MPESNRVTATLLAKHISKSFDNRPVLRDISIEIQPGQFVALTGGNGAGKTTFLKILAKLLRPDGGSVLINKQDIWKEADEIRREIGFLSHQIFLYDDLNCQENLRFTARLFGVKDPDDRIDYLLKQLHLFSRKYDPIKTFSRGMQQRLSLARAVLHNPNVLLLDEPFSGLDESGIEILSKIIEQFKTEGKSVVLVTHNLQKGYELADELYILHRGLVQHHHHTGDIPFEQFHREYRQMLEEGE